MHFQLIPIKNDLLACTARPISSHRGMNHFGNIFPANYHRREVQKNFPWTWVFFPVKFTYMSWSHRSVTIVESTQPVTSQQRMLGSTATPGCWRRDQLDEVGTSSWTSRSGEATSIEKSCPYHEIHDHPDKNNQTTRITRRPTRPSLARQLLVLLRNAPFLLYVNGPQTIKMREDFSAMEFKLICRLGLGLCSNCTARWHVKRHGCEALSLCACASSSSSVWSLGRWRT